MREILLRSDKQAHTATLKTTKKKDPMQTSSFGKARREAYAMYKQASQTKLENALTTTLILQIQYVNVLLLNKFNNKRKPKSCIDCYYTETSYINWLSKACVHALYVKACTSS